MANDAYSNFVASLGVTPQTQPIPGKSQVKNNAGGYSFKLDPWMQLERFLILGTEGGSYYASEQKLTQENAKMIMELLKLDGRRVVDTLVDVSMNGRAYKQNPTLFTLALATSYTDDATSDYADDLRRYALSKLNDVCRTGTMLFTYVEYTNKMRGWGTGLQKAIGNWYLDRTPDNLATQLVKYRQRGGWSHRDVLRKAHVKVGKLVGVNAITNTNQKGKEFNSLRGVYDQEHPNASLIAWATGKAEAANSKLVEGFLRAQKATTAKEFVSLIEEYKLPWEALPTQALNMPEVWVALAPHLGITALLRNLGKMGATGGLVSHSELAKIVNARITDFDAYKKARVHPMQVLLAGNVYAAGKGVKGNNTWNPVSTVVDNLNSAFYASFGALQTTGKRRGLYLDVSGSMTWGSISGTHLTPRDATAALALVAMNQDPESEIWAFTTNIKRLGITAKTRLNDAIKIVSNLPFGGTDCALPMVEALKNKTELDSFEIYTDSETWAGRSHPVQALKAYRDGMGINAKLIVNGMVSNGFSIADPSDGNSLDVVGFDANVPKVIDDFIR